jgi:hypothetical protein
MFLIIGSFLQIHSFRASEGVTEGIFLFLNTRDFLLSEILKGLSHEIDFKNFDKN